MLPIRPGDGAMNNDPQWHADAIASAVSLRGYCIFWSEVLEDKVAFVREPRFLRVIPKDMVAYTDEELRELFGEGKPYLSPESLKLIHETKKAGGVVTSHAKQGELL